MAKTEVIEEDSPQSAESTLDQRELNIDCRLLEWRDAYLKQVSKGLLPADMESSGSTGTEFQNPMLRSKKQGSGKPEASIDSLYQLSGDKQAAQKLKDSGQQTTAKNGNYQTPEYHRPYLSSIYTRELNVIKC